MSNTEQVQRGSGDSGPKFDPVTEKYIAEYKRQINESLGFCLPERTKDVKLPRKGRMDRCTDSEHVVPAAKLAVAQFNTLNGRDLQLKRTLRANVISSSGESLYYLTFECSDGGFYEVKVHKKGEQFEVKTGMRTALNYPRLPDTYCCFTLD